MLNPEQIQQATPSQAREWLREISGILPVLVAKASEAQELDRVISVEEGGKLIDKSRTWIYRRKSKLPFVVTDDAGRIAGCSLKGVQEYLRTRCNGG